jgi:hypothetical protein
MYGVSQTSLGALLEHPRLPLTKWSMAIHLMAQFKTNIAALALMHHLIISWKPGWLLKQCRRCGKVKRDKRS